MKLKKIVISNGGKAVGAGRLNTVQILRRFCFDQWGGTETVVWNTSKRLIEEGFDTQILSSCALAKAGGETVDGVNIKRFEYFYPYLNLKKQNKAKLDKKGGDPYSIKLFGYLMNLKNVDIFHSHTMGRLANMVRLVAHRKGVPYIVSLHGGCYDVPESEIEEMVKPLRGTFNYGKLIDLFLCGKSFLDRADGIVCVGHNEYVKVKEKYNNKPVIYLPNGVDAGKFADGSKSRFINKYNIPESAFVILFVGRIDHQKNQKLLVELLKKAKEKGHDVHLVLVGPVTSVDYMAEVDGLVREYSLGGNVTIIKGVRADSTELIDAYCSADCFILPSVHEPFGIVILEAWAAGKGVIASNVGGVTKLVDDGSSGLLFESNDLDGLFEKYLMLKDNAELGAHLASNGRIKVRDEYSWEIVTKKLIDFYWEVKKNFEDNR